MNALKEVEMNVCAVNSPLKEAVKTMSPVLLLRNCHPSYRVDFARALHKADIISETELHEFTKIH